MIKTELSRWLGMFFFRNFLLANFGLLLLGLCFSLMFYKVSIVKNGEFRRRLLWYFGTGAFYGFMAGLLWHPFFNEWLQWVLGIPNLLALLYLTHFLVIGGNYK